MFEKIVLQTDIDVVILKAVFDKKMPGMLIFGQQCAHVRFQSLSGAMVSNIGANIIVFDLG